MKKLFLLLGLALSVNASDWPVYRGPNHDGISTETGWSTAWPKGGPAKLWKAKVGIGFSSMVVSDGRVFTMGNAKNQDSVVAFDAVSGKKLWSHTYAAELGPLYYEGGPGATPTVEGDAVYTISKWGDVFCLGAADGKVRWKRQLRDQEGAKVVDWGFGGAPMPYGDLLLLNAGGAGMALEKASGKTVWKSKGDPGYSTPYPIDWDGRRLFMFSSGDDYSAVDPKNGNAAWSIEWVTRYGVNGADPIVADGLVFLSSGYGKGSGLHRVVKGVAEERWRSRKFRTQFNPAVKFGDRLFGFDGDTAARAYVKCVDWKSGDILWEDESLGFGSITAADGKLILLGNKGDLVVAKPSDKGLETIARAKVLGGKCWTVPVLANGLIYCRNAAGDLVCLDVRGKK
jgi:outer membrane protein assembly factor BamB